MNTDEAFLLSSLKEFVKIWGSGNQATLHVECRNGKAFLRMETVLGQPSAQHYNPCSNSPSYSKKPRKKSNGKIRSDNERAAAHNAKMAKNNIADAALESSEQSVSAVPALSEETNTTASDTVESDLHSLEDSPNDVASASLTTKETIPESGIRDMLEITLVGDTRKVVECDNNVIENEAVEATLADVAEKQAEAVEKRRFWLCIHHGCIDNTTLEELECSCCGLECEVVEYDSEEEYEPP